MTFQELGELLRKKRESLGLSLDDLSARTRISPRVLRVIEQGEQAAMPHAVYARSFIRTCGRELGLDDAELLVALDALFPNETPTAAIRPEGMRGATPAYSDTPRRVVFLLAFILLVGAVSWGGWYVFANYGDAIARLVKKPFAEETAAPAEAPARPSPPDNRDEAQGAAPAGN